MGTVLAGGTVGEERATATPPALPRGLRWWAIAQLFAPILSRSNRPAEQYRDHLATLTVRLWGASSGAAIVDTSKNWSHQIAMAALPAEVHLIRLLRDPRGVVWSRQRKLVAETGRVHRRHVVQDALAWSTVVVLGALMSRRTATGSDHVVWYDDLVADPQAVISSLAAIPAFTGATVDLDEQARLQVREDHAVGGNTRFRKRSPSADRRGRSNTWEPVELRLDERWRRELGGLDRVFVAALTAPARLVAARPSTGGDQKA